MSRLMLAAVGLGLFVAANVRAATYDAVADFDGVDNPSGAWSYLYSNTVGGALTPLTLASNLAGTGIPFFWTHQGVPDSVVVARNPGPATLSYETIVQPPTLLEVDPESLVADVQWTAPAAGTYTVSGIYQGIDTGQGSHAVEVLQNNAGTPLFSDTIASFGQQAPFNFQATVASGDTLDFLVAYTGDFSNLSTGFDATISIPEPTSLAALAGFGALMIRRRRA